MKATRWPLTGRSDELSFLAGLGRAGDGPAGVMLAGAPGVGKTRLAREAMYAAERRGAVIRWAAATASARELPLGVFTAWLPAERADPMWLLRDARRALLADVGPGRHVVVGVDDAHLLDELSAALVHQLVLRREAVVVLTLRSGSVAPDAVTALWKDGGLQRLEVQPLSETASTALLEAVLGGPVSRSAAHRLWTVTQGNALYLQQLVDGELGAGRITAVDGVWRWTRDPHLPPGLAELVQARIGGLTGAEREVVDLLAFAEPLGVSLLAGLVDPAAVEQAEARGLIEVSQDGRRWQARLAHPLYGELQRVRCGRLRARRLRGRIAIALAQAGGRRADDLLRRATLLLDADTAPDLELLMGAAWKALRLADVELVERIGRAALAAGGGAEARLALAIGLLGQGRLDELRAGLHGVADIDVESPLFERAATMRIMAVFWTLSSPAEAQQSLDEVSARVRGRPVAVAFSALRSVLLATLARPTEAIAEGRAVLAASTGVDAPTVLGCWGLATACGGLGRLDLLRGELTRILGLGIDRFDPPSWRLIGIGNVWTRALRLAGLLGEAEQEAAWCLRVFAEASGNSRPVSYVVYGLVLLDMGKIRSATRWFRDAAGDLRGKEPVWSYIAALGSTMALGMAGDPAAVQAGNDMQALRHPALVFREPDRLLALAWCAAAEGARSDATTLAHQAADLAADQQQPAVEVTALHTAVCFGDRTVAARLAELATLVQGPRAPAAAAHAAALAAADTVGLLDVSARLEQMGALLLAADAAAQAAACELAHGFPGAPDAPPPVHTGSPTPAKAPGRRRSPP
jgi:hypothetical protein